MEVGGRRGWWMRFGSQYGLVTTTWWDNSGLCERGEIKDCKGCGIWFLQNVIISRDTW